MVQGAGDDDGQLEVVFGKELVQGEQARLEYQDVVARFDRQQINPAGNQTFDLTRVGDDEIIEGHRARARQVFRFIVKRFVRWADTPGHETRLVGRPAIPLLGG